MERPHSQGPDLPEERSSLWFNLNQAAAICGVPVQQLSEWTDCGYIRVKGHGDSRRFDREALREVLALRDAIRGGRFNSANARRKAGESTSPVADPETRRPEEFPTATEPLQDAHLALQAEMYFALNSRKPLSAAQLAERLGVPKERMEEVLAVMASARLVQRVCRGGETLFGPGRASLHGPGPRELRIRARRRSRIATDRS